MPHINYLGDYIIETPKRHVIRLDSYNKIKISKEGHIIDSYINTIVAKEDKATKYTPMEKIFDRIDITILLFPVGYIIGKLDYVAISQTYCSNIHDLISYHNNNTNVVAMVDKLNKILLIGNEIYYSNSSFYTVSITVDYRETTDIIPSARYEYYIRTLNTISINICNPYVNTISVNIVYGCRNHNILDLRKFPNLMTFQIKETTIDVSEIILNDAIRRVNNRDLFATITNYPSGIKLIETNHNIMPILKLILDDKSFTLIVTDDVIKYDAVYNRKKHNVKMQFNKNTVQFLEAYIASELFDKIDMEYVIAQDKDKIRFLLIICAACDYSECPYLIRFILGTNEEYVSRIMKNVSELSQYAKDNL